MTRNSYFLERARDFYNRPSIVLRWARKGSCALRVKDHERFHECMCLVSLWEYLHYKTRQDTKYASLEAWKNYVFHLRAYNTEYYDM